MCASVSLRSALERGGRALTVARRSHYSNLLCFGNDWTRALRCIPKGTEFLPTHAFATQNQRVSNQANSFAIYAHMPPDREREKQTTQNSGSGLRALFDPYISLTLIITITQKPPASSRSLLSLKISPTAQRSRSGSDLTVLLPASLVAFLRLSRGRVGPGVEGSLSDPRVEDKLLACSGQREGAQGQLSHSGDVWW